MNEQMDKYSEDLVKKIMKQTEQQSPSLDFTNSVMSKIEAISETKQFKYKPLIPRFTRYLIAASFVGLMVFLSFNSETKSLGLFDAIGFSKISNYNMGNLLPELAISKTVMYSVIMLGVMLLVQITMLKQYHNKNFQA